MITKSIRWNLQTYLLYQKVWEWHMDIKFNYLLIGILIVITKERIYI